MTNKNRHKSYGRDHSGSDRSPNRANPDRNENAGNVFIEWIKSLIIAGLFFMLIRTFILQTFVITSGSMENTLLVGDFLVANRAAVGARIPGTKIRIPGYSRAKRDEVIVFDPPHEPDLKLVKRLIGMPGDTVEMQEDKVLINGKIKEEPYAKYVDQDGDIYHPWMDWQFQYLVDTIDRSSYHPTRSNWGPLVIPEDQYFMLGDNRDSSLDSRYWGLLEGWRIEGKATFIYFSYNKGSLKPFPWIREIRGNRSLSRIR